MQRPSALGLTLCDQIIIDRETLKPSLIGVFTAFSSNHFPTSPRHIEVFAALTDGQGRVVLDLVVTNLNTEEQIAGRSMEQEFPDPLRTIHARFRLLALSFPEPGTYLFELRLEDEVICYRRLSVHQRENPT